MEGLEKIINTCFRLLSLLENKYIAIWIEGSLASLENILIHQELNTEIGRAVRAGTRPHHTQRHARLDRAKKSVKGRTNQPPRNDPLPPRGLWGSVLAERSLELCRKPVSGDIPTAQREKRLHA